MAALSKLRLSPQTCTIASGIALVSFLLYRKSNSGKKKSGREEVKVVIAQHGTKKERAAVNSVFFSQLGKILKILVPGVFSVEAWYLTVVAVSLVIRTYADVWMIQNGTYIESAIIGRNPQQFKRLLLKFVYAMPAISFVNNCLKYGVNMLKLKFRERLSQHLYDRYLNGFTFYKMSNLDNRISNADQLLTQDAEKFCDSVAELYTNLSKPILDVILYSVKLAGAIGAQGPTYMLLYLAVSGLFLTRLRRPVGRMTVIEQRYEGEYRYVNSRLITNSEEIAFYQGNKKEQFIITGTFKKLVDHLKNFIFFRVQMGFIDNIVAKYVATVVGYLVVSRPFLDMSHPRHLNSSHSDLLEDYFKSGRMLVKMAEAIGRIILAGRELTRLAGFTSRVTELMKVLEDLNAGRYERTMVKTEASQGSANNMSPPVALKPGSGNIIIKDHIIKFDKVPLVTPNGDVLIKEMTFEVKSGMNVLVCGPNGCGKSSLFRVLGELWPLFGGTVTKPAKGKLFYVPQRPYMAVGTLRDQVIYPDSHVEQVKKGVMDHHLEDILAKVQLDYILKREGGWNSAQDWMDVLSGGEKQRIAMARLFYHKPQFAILDECTSAVSVDVEGFMYQYCREVGITLFTVSHRKSLWSHHEYYLKMDGRGNYEYKPITDDTSEFGS